MKQSKSVYVCYCGSRLVEPARALVLLGLLLPMTASRLVAQPTALTDPLVLQAAAVKTNTQATIPQPDGAWCTYPVGKQKKPGAAARIPGLAQLLPVTEVEPNDTIATAQVIPLGSGLGQDRDLDITGTIATATDQDVFRFTAAKGDIIGAASLGGGAPDTELFISDLAGTILLLNDDHGNIASIYPPSSPFPGGVNARDSALTWVAPADGDYLITVRPWNAASSGPYTLQIRSRRPAYEQELCPNTQTVFLDFDGATINPLALFGSGPSSATLSPLSSFLSGWGLGPANESAVIDAIIATIQENFDSLRTAALNGDRDTDGIHGHFDVVLRNSRDDPDTFGAPNVSRLIIGGSIAELGISTIGIAEYIDPGNFSTTDTGVVLLDLMSQPVPPPDPNSINNMARDPGFTIIDAIGRVVGNVITHEIGHYLGNWHTENNNSVFCIMDQGGFLPENMGGIGPDNILGTIDDIDVDFIGDLYENTEGIATAGTERTDVRTAFGLATGAVPAPTGDFDGDGDADGIDFLTFSNCFNGSLNPPVSTCAFPDKVDIDGDNDVDGNDFLTFSNCFNGSLNPSKCP